MRNDVHAKWLGMWLETGHLLGYLRAHEYEHTDQH